MTDIGRKRTLQQFFKGTGNKAESKPLSTTAGQLKGKKRALTAKDTNITDKLDKSVEESLKNA